MITEARSFRQRFVGMMGKHDADPLFFRNARSLHSLFMRFELDVVFVDEAMTVTSTRTLRPWRFCRGDRLARHVLEARRGQLLPRYAPGMRVELS